MAGDHTTVVRALVGEMVTPRLTVGRDESTSGTVVVTTA
jgi:hypothetical protein